MDGGEVVQRADDTEEAVRKRLDLYAAEVPAIQAEGFTRPITALADEALPSVMRKCVAALA